MTYRNDYGTWALVVGGSTTVGEQFARQLGAKGMNVAMVSRRQEKLDEIGAEIRDAHGVETRSIALDLMNEGALDALFEATSDLEIGYLVVNANLHKVNYFHLMPIEHKHVMLRMNYEMPVKLTHHFGARMVERSKGAVVFINALNALTPIDIDAVFQGTKAALRVFSESLWLEYRKHGVRVGSAQVNGIEGSESYEAKLSPGRRKLAKLIGVSMAPRLIVARAMKQLDRGKAILVPDTFFFINHLGMKFFDFLRFLGGNLMRRAGSRLFYWFLNGDEVQAGIQSKPPELESDAPSAPVTPPQEDRPVHEAH